MDNAGNYWNTTSAVGNLSAVTAVDWYQNDPNGPIIWGTTAGSLGAELYGTNVQQFPGSIFLAEK